jgi:outer membrane murein-binding lipoprotein Lpp
MSLLKASTEAIKSGSSTDDSTYDRLEGQIAELTSRRDALASQIRAALDGAAFGGVALNEGRAKGWIDQADSLIDQAVALGG